jgi:hypothetical protein
MTKDDFQSAARNILGRDMRSEAVMLSEMMAVRNTYRVSVDDHIQSMHPGRDKFGKFLSYCPPQKSIRSAGPTLSYKTASALGAHNKLSTVAPPSTTVFHPKENIPITNLLEVKRSKDETTACEYGLGLGHPRNIFDVLFGDDGDCFNVSNEPFGAKSSRKRECPDTDTDVATSMEAHKKRKKDLATIKDYNYWTPEQENLLKEAIRVVGKKWAKITKAYPQFEVWGRSQTNIKDKWRNMERRGLSSGVDNGANGQDE